MQLTEDIRKKITEAVIRESAQLDGIRPEEMLHSVVDYLEGAEPRNDCTTAKMMGHRGVRVDEDIVRRIAIAVVKEAEQLEGVDPEEMLQKVVGSLQGESITEVAPVSNESLLFTGRGVVLEDEICKKISEAVIKEAAQLEGVVPGEAIEKVLTALRAQPTREVASSAALREMATTCPVTSAKKASARPASMAGTERINPTKTSYHGYPIAEKGTDPKEVVIGVGPGFQKEIQATICGIPLSEVIREVKAGIEEEGMVPRVVKVLKTSDVCFMGLEAAKISGSGIGIGLQSKGTAVIHQKDLYPLSNLELFPQAPLMSLETYRKIGQNAAKYAKGEQVTPISSVNDPMCRAKYQVKAAIMHIAETEQVDPNYPIIAWSDR